LGEMKMHPEKRLGEVHSCHMVGIQVSISVNFPIFPREKSREQG